MFEYMYDSHKGETCVVIGNGPSLNSVPSSFFERYVTFGSNRIYTKLIPTYYVCVNPLVLEQFNWDIENIECLAKFVPDKFEIPHAYKLHSLGIPMFSYNPCDWIYEGYTVTFVSLQLAFFMGFSKVLLVGVDHSYKFDGEPNQELVMTGADPNHFDPDYFRDVRWNAPDLAQSEKAYMLAKEAYERNGRQIINITEGSALHVFDKENAPWVP